MIVSVKCPPPEAYVFEHLAPASDTLLRCCGTFRWWSLIGGSGSLRAIREDVQPALASCLALFLVSITREEIEPQLPKPTAMWPPAAMFSLHRETVYF